MSSLVHAHHRKSKKKKKSEINPGKADKSSPTSQFQSTHLKAQFPAFVLIPVFSKHTSKFKQLLLLICLTLK